MRASRLFPVVVVSSLAGCAASPGNTSSTSGSSGWYGEGGDAPEDGASTDEGTTTDQQGGQGVASLTAGTWDDNLNFSFYLSYLSATEGASLPGIPRVRRADRVTASVTGRGHAPMGGARVELLRGSEVLSSTITGADGHARLYPNWSGASDGEELGVRAVVGASVVSVALAADQHEVYLDFADIDAEPVRAMDVALVVDTTGSMGDELTYLTNEIEAIAAAVSSEFPDVATRWALVVYRDLGDDYVVRSHDFTSDVSAFQDLLSEQRSGGGGDYPEALHDGLREMTTLSWTGGNTARVAFLVADAPHHEGTEGNVVESLQQARRKGVHIYPLAASGTDELAEFTMRTAAQLTDGRYLFLTDDSGIGGAHKEPSLPCYAVTRLDDAMKRMLAIEVSGVYREAPASQIIRVGGNPTDGMCTLSTGEHVEMF